MMNMISVFFQFFSVLFCITGNFQYIVSMKYINLFNLHVHTKPAALSAVIIMFIFMLLGLSGCTSEDQTETDAAGTEAAGETSFIAGVSILPQKYFLDRIAPDGVEVVVMVPPGRNPASYEPTPKQIEALSSAALFFAVGVPFEEAFLPILERNLQDMTIVHTDAGIEKRRFRTAHTREEEGPDAHENGAEDPHIWLSPVYAEQIAAVMADALKELLPQQAAEIDENLRTFSNELQQLDRRLTDLLEPFSGEHLLVYHPAFGYFADRYGLVQQAIETGGKEPSPRQLAEIIEVAAEEQIRILFVQPEFNQKSAQAAAEAINGTVVPVSSLEYDYIENLRHIAEAVSRIGAEKEGEHNEER